ncbi:MAG: hypothetical protein F7C07_07915 [Desulfurococcales archaeon]|nr:hypothetical protein [Desulfurococcales archaeon]
MDPLERGEAPAGMKWLALAVLATILIAGAYYYSAVEPAKPPTSSMATTAQPTNSSSSSANSGVLLVLDREVYKQGDRLEARVVNMRLSNIYMGLEYLVYKNVNGSWIIDEALTPKAWPDLLIAVKPGGSYKLEIDLGNATPGLYRLVKEVWLDDRGQNKILLEASFKVTS